MQSQEKPIIHKESDFEGMRKAGRLAAEILDKIAEYVKPGVTTESLDKLCHDMVIEAGATPACLGYKGYPKTICTSVNHVICHGIPSSKVLKEGDIVNIDITVIVDGWHGDTSRIYFVGKNIQTLAKRLVAATHECLMLGIEAVKPGAKLSDIGKAIQAHADKYGFSVVRDYCGHGIGKSFHAEPSVLHYYDPKYDMPLMPGMFFTIEPMINAGGYAGKVLNDGWTVVTRDRSLSAQFEHTVGVTQNGIEIFTLSPSGIFYQEA